MWVTKDNEIISDAEPDSDGLWKFAVHALTV
jgi:hypothetical protein